ncbi:MAG: hypothetical protein ABI771_15115 [Betaproteobacteria bacterium]
MNKLPIALLVSAMVMSTGALAAEPNAQAAKQAPQDCSKLSGKEKDKCVQATPAGPVDMQTGAQKKGKSEVAKDRDRAKAKNEGGADSPAQSGDGVGHPGERAATGEAQTGAGTDSSANATPAQDAGKDVVRKKQ